MKQERLNAFTQSFLAENAYNRPLRCEKCSGIMVFCGVGEYQCEDCGEKALDDYGKVRNYLESHKGATSVEVETMTGVTQKSIRRMLREERLEVSADSRSFLSCEVCGASIRSGRYCKNCLALLNKQCEDLARAGRTKPQMTGISNTKPSHNDDGAKRFIREK